MAFPPFTKFGSWCPGELSQHCPGQNATRCRYESSIALRVLRAQRRQAVERSIKKQFSFDIAKLHRRELRAWKSFRLHQLLNMSHHWKFCTKCHTPWFDSAHSMLENFYHGHPRDLTRPLHLTEPNWSVQELNGAIKRLKMNKASDECGLVAELFVCCNHPTPQQTGNAHIDGPIHFNRMIIMLLFHTLDTAALSSAMILSIARGRTKTETRTFQPCRISWGGPTTGNSCLQRPTSSAANSCLKIVWWPAAKHATGVTIAWQNVRRCKAIFWEKLSDLSGS